ncbi:MAG: hypothetical protein AAF826_13075 [Pseudomonadota bacterium]
MKRWVQNPPSMKMVRLVVGVVLACIALVAYEYMFGWPEALTAERMPRRPMNF